MTSNSSKNFCFAQVLMNVWVTHVNTMVRVQTSWLATHVPVRLVGQGLYVNWVSGVYSINYADACVLLFCYGYLVIS